MLRLRGHVVRASAARARSEEPPRLILRFAVLTAIALALAASAILLVVRHLTTAQAERAATHTARVVADSVRGELVPSDFAGPVADARRSQLDELFGDVLVDGILLVQLFSRDGVVTYASDHRLIGRTDPADAKVGEVFEGMVVSDVGTLEGSGAERPAEVLRAYVPVPLGRQEEAGAMAIHQDYGPIADAAKEAFFPVAGILEVVLVGLYAVLFPVLRRVTRRIRRQMEEIEHLALHDDLTGLPNRTLFRDRAEQAMFAARRAGDEVAVLLLDLDRFKEINDALGHRSGDVLLCQLADRLRGVLREHETLARLGGDEFAVLVPRLSDETVPRLAERLLGALEEPFTVDGLALAVEASLGAARYPAHGEEVDLLMQRADVAMYLAKAERCRFAVYAPEHDPNDPRRLTVVGELRGALERRELLLHFQPKADAATGEVVGVEALVRWQHPERGLLAPGDFIPYAERTGLIGPLSRYVIEAALEQSRAWRREGIDLAVAVNVTVPNLLDLDFAIDVARLVRRLDVAPGALQLEITESTIMADPFRARQLLERLSRAGVRLAIDDYGTGYSSLAYLKRLPVSELKIDRSFVGSMATDESDAAIVRSTIELGRNLGLQVVAEGVETRETWDALAALGCDLVQGFLVGRPAPAAEVADLVRSRATTRDRGSARAEVPVLPFSRRAAGQAGPLP